MKKRIALLILVMAAGALLAVALVSAQQPPQQPPPPMDPLGDVIFPPELIMGHTRDLGLTDEQKTFMRAEIQKSTTRFNELQWQVQDAMEALHALMKANPVSEQQALAQLDKVLDTEREIKRLHFGLAIALKNKLTPEQRAKLHELMMQMHQGGGGPGRGPGPGGLGPGGPGGGPGPGGPGGPVRRPGEPRPDGF